jgi:hypothetical protein
MLFAGPIDFIVDQSLILGPLSALLWITGVILAILECRIALESSGMDLRPRARHLHCAQGEKLLRDAGLSFVVRCWRGRS